MITYDVHMHTAFSSDSEEAPENQIEKAIELGLKGLCITDHMDIDYPDIDELSIDFLFNPEEYFEKLESLKAKYGSKLDLLFGMEIGLRNEPGEIEICRNSYEEIIEKYPFDFIIGSTHCLENCDPYLPKYWKNKNSKEGLNLYFEAVLENLNNFSNFDTLGHLDYLVRYVNEASVKEYQQEMSHITKANILLDCDKRYMSNTAELDYEVFSRYGYRVSDYADVLDEILKTLISKGKALEINTAGLKYGMGFAHPKYEILARYKELGGELITIGSDAHKTIHIAYDFEKANEMLESLGFKYYFVYRNRKPEAIRL